MRPKNRANEGQVARGTQMTWDSTVPQGRTVLLEGKQKQNRQYSHTHLRVKQLSLLPLPLCCLRLSGESGTQQLEATV